MVKNEAAFDFIAASERRGLGTTRCALGKFLAGRVLFRFAAGEAVPPTR
jgi:hypothetical protein